MRGVAALIGAIALAPPAAGAQEQSICRFQTICTDKAPCEAAEPGAAIQLRTTGDNTAEITIEDKSVSALRAETPNVDPVTYFAAEPDTSGALMLSVFEDGTGIASLHGDLFGPFAVTMFGTCSEAAQ